MKTAKSGIKIFLVISMLLFMVKSAFAMDISGNFLIGLQFRYENGDYPGFKEQNNFISYFSSNLTFSNMSDKLFYYLLDLNIKGDLVAQDKSADLGIEQCYLQFSVFDFSYIYCGLKNRDMGTAHYFSVGDRLNPNHINGISQSGGTPGLVEYFHILSGSTAYGLLAYFRDAQSYDDINLAAYLDYSKGNFSWEMYHFLEQLKNQFLFTSLAYQCGNSLFYLDAVWQRNPEQYSIIAQTGNTDNDFKRKNEKNMLATTLGISYTSKGKNLLLEYTHRQEGYNMEEQQTYLDYLQAYDGIGLNYYSLYNFARNYLVASVAWDMASLPDLNFEVAGILSFQPGDKDYSSMQYLGKVTYQIEQNCALSLNVSHISGGKCGEFTNLAPNKSTVGVALNYHF